MNLRQIRGMEIVKEKGIYIRKVKDGWLVPSQTSEDLYKVAEDFTCNCPDSQKRSSTCKHAFAVRYSLDQKKDADSKNKSKISYTQNWKAYTQAQTEEGTLFNKLLSDLVALLIKSRLLIKSEFC